MRRQNKIVKSDIIENIILKSGIVDLKANVLKTSFVEAILWHGTMPA